jgi:6-phosphogluconolactonase
MPEIRSGALERTNGGRAARAGGLSALSLIALFLAFAGSALAFQQVPGSPFAIGGRSVPFSVAFSPNGRLLATADGIDGAPAANIAVFSVNDATGALTPVPGSPFPPGSGGGPYSVTFNPAGTLLATANDTFPGAVSVFAVSAEGALTEIPGSPFVTGGNASQSVAFSPDGKLLAASNFDSESVSLFSVASNGGLTLAPQSPFSAGNGPIGVMFSPDGSLLAAADNDLGGAVSVFSVNGRGVASAVPGSPFPDAGSAFAVAFSPSGGVLATANIGGSDVSVFSVGSTGVLSPLTGSPFAAGSGPISIAFNPAGTLLATANETGGVGIGTASVFEVSSDGALTPATERPLVAGSYPSSVAFSPDGSLLAIANENDGTVSVFSTSSLPVALTFVLGRIVVTGATAHVPIACHGTAGPACSVKLSVSVTVISKGKKVIGVSASAKRKRKTVLIATTRAVVIAGQTKDVSISLDKTGKRLLARFHTLKTELTLSQSGQPIVPKILKFTGKSRSRGRGGAERRPRWAASGRRARA